MAAITFACLFVSGELQAEATVGRAIAAGVPLIDIRLRFEGIDQEDKPRNAAATTLRARLGYETGSYRGISVLAEFDAVQHLGPRRYFDSIGGGSPALYPTVADPDLVALNRLQLSHGAHVAASDMPDLRLTVGRQRIVFADARFIGNVAWRQHEQTYDGIALANTSLPALTLTYAYITAVNRVFGPDSATGRWDSHSHFFNALYGGLLPALKLEGYAYLLDLRQVPLFSTATYGFRADGVVPVGNRVDALFTGGYANQRDYGRNPLSLNLSYYRAEAGLSYGGWTGLLGYEVLGGNGTMGFQTPLATLHAFQGWAETFLVKPPAGIEDVYVRGGYATSLAPFADRVTASVIYHDFSAERGSENFGSEWDATIEAALNARLMVGAAYANYRGAGGFPDKAVFWLYTGYRY